MKYFKRYLAVGLKEKKVDRGEGKFYIYYFIAKYIQPVNKMRSEIIE